MFITLTSDLGKNNVYIGIAEATLLNRLPSAKIIHITHEITPFKILENAYFLKCSVGHYPPETYHLVLSDILMDLPAQLMLCRVREQIYIGIDNGILPAAFSAQEHQFYIYKKVSSGFQELLLDITSVLYSLSNKPENENSDFLPYRPKKLYEFPKVVRRENELECAVIFIDRYGNSVTNLHREEFYQVQQGRKYRIQFLRNEIIDEITETYTSSEYGGIAAYFNEFGFLQIAMKDKNANSSSILGLNPLQTESLINNYIRIIFE